MAVSKYSLKLAKLISEKVATGDQRIQDVCTHFGIHMDTYYHWQNVHPEFKQMIEVAKDRRLDTLGELAESGLKLLITQQECLETVTEFENDENGNPKVKGKKVTKKVIMPSPAAVMFTLANADKRYKQKQSIEHLDKDGMPTNPTLTVIASPIPLAGSEKEVNLD